MKGNQKIKILRIMQILLENTDDEHGLTLEEITQKLSLYGIDADRKTLYDDFDVLRVFGVDVEMQKDGRKSKMVKTNTFIHIRKKLMRY